MNAPVRRTRHVRRLAKRAATLSSVVLFVYGAVAFSTPAFIGSVKPNRIGARTEMPVGWVEDAFVDRYGTIYCASAAWYRVQLYDHEKRFIRGWFVNASGSLMIRVDAEGHVRVLAPRPELEFVFDDHGRQLWSESYSPRKRREYDVAEETVMIPTAWYLLPFAHPPLGWVMSFVGMAVLAAMSKRRVRHRRPGVAERSSAFAQ